MKPYFSSILFFLGCLICDRVNATIFKKKTKQTENDEEISLAAELNNLYVGQEILIVIKNIQYEQNDLFLIANFHSIVDDNKIE